MGRAEKWQAGTMRPGGVTMQETRLCGQRQSVFARAKILSSQRKQRRESVNFCECEPIFRIRECRQPS